MNFERRVSRIFSRVALHEDLEKKRKDIFYRTLRRRIGSLFRDTHDNPVLDARTNAKVIRSTFMSVATKLRQEGFLIHEDYRIAAEAVLRQVQSEFPSLKNPGVVVLGSGSSGLAYFSRLYNSLRSSRAAHQSDFDWCFTFDAAEEFPDPSDQSQKVVTTSFGKRIANIGDRVLRVSGKGLLQCNVMNPIREGLLFRNLISEEDAYNVLKNLLKIGNIGDAGYYFFPSFPNTVNIKNREYVLSALRKIHKENPTEWSAAVNAIYKHIVKYRKVKNGHLPKIEDKKTRVMADWEYRYSFGSESSRAIKDLLSSTAADIG